MPAPRTTVFLALLCASSMPLGGGHAIAANGVPPAAELPRRHANWIKSVAPALALVHGDPRCDTLIAEAAVKTSEGAVLIAGAVQNPVVNASVLNGFTWSWTRASQNDCNHDGAVCTPWGYNFGINDAAAIEDTLSGKRDLRLKVARNALAAAKMSRVDAARTIGFQVKSAYVQVAQSQLAYRFAKDVAVTQVTTLKKFQDRYRAGAVSEGDLERIEVTKLEFEPDYFYKAVPVLSPHVYRQATLVN